jgi:hypothetical protein
MAGGFAACGCAADPFIFIKSDAVSREDNRLSGTVHAKGLKKPFFQRISLTAFTFG